MDTTAIVKVVDADGAQEWRKNDLPGVRRRPKSARERFLDMEYGPIDLINKFAPTLISLKALARPPLTLAKDETDVLEKMAVELVDTYKDVANSMRISAELDRIPHYRDKVQYLFDGFDSLCNSIHVAKRELNDARENEVIAGHPQHDRCGRNVVMLWKTKLAGRKLLKSAVLKMARAMKAEKLELIDKSEYLRFIHDSHSVYEGTWRPVTKVIPGFGEIFVDLTERFMGNDGRFHVRSVSDDRLSNAYDIIISFM